MDFDTLDLDKLATLMRMCGDAGLTEFKLGPLELRFAPPAPEPPTIETPMNPRVDTIEASTPSGYATLLGGSLPKWPKKTTE